MTNRNFKEIKLTTEFVDFINKYQLKLKCDSEERIILQSNCLIIEIHGLYIEDILYFDFYTKDLAKYCNVDRLLSLKESKKIQEIYEKEKTLRTKPLVKNALDNNPDRTLRAEQFFFSYIKIMDELLNDFLRCKLDDYMIFFSPTFENKKQELMKILN